MSQRSRKTEELEIYRNYIGGQTLQYKKLVNVALSNMTANVDMLYQQHDQTVTDRICGSSLLHHLQRKYQAGDLP